ncbi:MAG: ArgR family transcriptional regulator [Paludibacteraceae bacterium]|nr:ArgR family transcriptional regulator [Paludibacteraceae bacterium]
MNIRQNRIHTIVKILNAQIITSQEQLTKALQQQGIEVTQATLSRDLRELRAEKKVLPNGATRYVIPMSQDLQKRVLGMDSEIAKLSIRSVDFCGQFAVVKTKPGFANAVAYDIDDRGGEIILGTIAGDDTILIIPRENTTRDMLFDFLYSV